jgi:demethylmenaquinone methyltransferase/2-methoxy-6-polyprenyl-1,4-benzoquinol methylase
MELTQEMSKVEVTGFEARYYDILMNILTLGWYPSFIRRVVEDMEISEGDSILDFGAGTGRNALLMRRYTGDSGRIVGLEIGREMIEQFNSRCAEYDNIRIDEKRIDEEIPYSDSFDIVFISFVLHGFVQEKRDIIIENARKALVPGGRFAILDYANFDISEAPLHIRLLMEKVECPLASDFVRRDTVEMLERHGFGSFEEKFYFGGYLRLLTASV